MKKSKFQTKVLVPLIGALCITSPFAIGFSMWAATGGYDGMASGMFRSDDVEIDPNYVEVFDNVQVGEYSFAENYGFLNTLTKIYSMSTTLNGQCNLNISTASSLIDSMLNHKKMKITIGVTSTYTDFGTRFSSSSITLTGTGLVVDSSTNITTSNSVISKTFSITVPDQSSISLSFSIALTCSNGGKTPGQVGYFPDLKTYPLTFKLSPGEAE